MTFWDNKTVLVTGGGGFLGKHVVEQLRNAGVDKDDIHIPRSQKVDLRLWENCQKVVHNIDIVIHLAGVVGGIGYNMENPGSVFYDNAVMGIQLMEAARQASVEKFVVAGSVCSYPKFTPVPFNEKTLWDGYPEETNAPYGFAKKMMLIQGLAYRQQYDFNAIHLLLVNLYGPGDNFDPRNSHVIAALIKKFIDAQTEGRKEVTIWGTGSASREFLYVDDAAQGILRAAELYNKPEPVNLGAGMEISIRDLVTLIAELTEYDGEIVWDKTKPNGQPRRCLDVSLAKQKFGFSAQTDFRTGIKNTINWYKDYLNKNLGENKIV
ncbi:MAG: GDP-L-fucose synthase [Candidatus Cloacimonadaceae bacterium]